MTWYAGLEAICRADVPLSEHTWYGLGGPAQWLVTPTDEAQLADVLRRCRAADIPWRVLGHGANVLVSDAGVRGVVIMLTAPAFTAIAFDDPCIHCGGGADFAKLVKQSVERGLAGLEGLAGIPGSVGGILRMNAGGKYGSIAGAVDSVRVIDAIGASRTLAAGEVEWSYRHTSLHDLVVTAATLRLSPGDRASLVATYQRIWREKSAAQPAVAARSAGCIFKNPPQHAAGALIDQCGLKGCRRGAAEISTRHANFIVAYPGAATQDVLDLISHAKECVQQQHGVALELEVELW